MLFTGNGTPAPVRWIFAKRWRVAEMRSRPNLMPICISKGALGVNLPARDLKISQQHRILVKGTIAQRMFGSDEVPVPAKALLSLPGIYVDEPSHAISYYHVMLETHEIIFSEGLRSESLYLGPNAIASIPETVLKNALDVLGLCKENLAKNEIPPARPLAPMKQARRLIKRHRRNGIPIIEPSPMEMITDVSKRDLPFFMS